MGKVLLTAASKKELEERLEYLKSTGRAEVAERIRVAREFGDLSENAEYDIAKDEQGKMEAEILELEQKLANCEVIDSKKIGTEVISLGNKVKIKFLNDNKIQEYILVGSYESDPLQNKLSNESPIGKALLGKKVGDKIQVQVLKGIVELEVLKISKIS